MSDEPGGAFQGATFERTDEGLRQWPVAGLSLLALAVLFGTLMKADR
jgi:hypothetical protein